MIACIKDPKNFTWETPTTDKYCQYSNCIQNNLTKSVALLYTEDQWFEKEIMETIYFTIASNNISWENSKQVKNLR